MKDQELVNAIRRLKVETGSLACMGCGHEHNCGVSGCAVMREAADRIANQNTHILALQKEIEGLRGDLKLHRCATCDFWRENDPRCMNGQSQWGGKTVPRNNYCLYWERHTDWIPVEERLPEAPVKKVLVFVPHAHGNIVDVGLYLGADGWVLEGWYLTQNAVTHWMPLPKAPEVMKK